VPVSAVPARLAGRRGFQPHGSIAARGCPKRDAVADQRQRFAIAAIETDTDRRRLSYRPGWRVICHTADRNDARRADNGKP